jgi:hypothetical protein
MNAAFREVGLCNCAECQGKEALRVLIGALREEIRTLKEKLYGRKTENCPQETGIGRGSFHYGRGRDL